MRFTFAFQDGGRTIYICDDHGKEYEVVDMQYRAVPNRYTLAALAMDEQLSRADAEFGDQELLFVALEDWAESNVPLGERSTFDIEWVMFHSNLFGIRYRVVHDAQSRIAVASEITRQAELLMGLAAKLMKEAADESNA